MFNSGLLLPQTIEAEAATLPPTPPVASRCFHSLFLAAGFINRPADFPFYVVLKWLKQTDAAQTLNLAAAGPLRVGGWRWDCEHRQVGPHSDPLCFVSFKDLIIFFLPQTCRARKSQRRIDAVSKQCAAAFCLRLACDFIMAALISLSSKRPMRGDEVTLHH